MRALDTNVLVRYLTADDSRQLAAAARFVDRCTQDGEFIFLPALVLCELVWVLSRCYEQSKTEIAGILERILQTEQFKIEHDVLVRRSLEGYRKGKADFSDYLIGEISRASGCRDTVTFGRALKGTPGFTML
jgi:predicted nucleic-acid-binding protein